jgi:hypothetical protein
VLPGQARSRRLQFRFWVRAFSRSATFARQARKVAGFVDEEKVAGVMKIFSDEFVGLKFELDVVVAFDLGRNIAAPKVHCDFPRTNSQL